MLMIHYCTNMNYLFTCRMDNECMEKGKVNEQDRILQNYFVLHPYWQKLNAS